MRLHCTVIMRAEDHTAIDTSNLGFINIYICIYMCVCVCVYTLIQLHHLFLFIYSTDPMLEQLVY